MGILQLLYPSKCIFCRRALDRQEKHICKVCEKTIPWVRGSVCLHCGKPVAGEEQAYCMDCSAKDSFLTSGRAVFVYDDAMREAVAEFKYAGDLELGGYFAQIMAEKLAPWLDRWEIDGIVPVPLHRSKIRFRGFNQAAVLAEKIGAKAHVPVYEEGLIRCRNTRPQKGLSNKERSSNVGNAFAFGNLPAVHKVLLVDDIYTTGKTLEACGKMLKKHGVEKIFFACLCIGKDF